MRGGQARNTVVTIRDVAAVRQRELIDESGGLIGGIAVAERSGAGRDVGQSPREVVGEGVGPDPGGLLQTEAGAQTVHV